MTHVILTPTPNWANILVRVNEREDGMKKKVVYFTGSMSVSRRKVSDIDYYDINGIDGESIENMNLTEVKGLISMLQAACGEAANGWD